MTTENQASLPPGQVLSNDEYMTITHYPAIPKKNEEYPDMLVDMMQRQLALQQRAGHIQKIFSSPQLHQQYVNQMVLALVEEAVEIAKASGHKNPDFVPFGWKKTQKPDAEEAKKEIVDAMHFVLNLAIAFKMTPVELWTKFVEKNDENEKRRTGGY